MTAQQSDVYAGDAQPWADDEIDLRKYLMIVAAWWREILLIVVVVVGLTAAGAWFWLSRQPTTYAAGADVVIARLTSRVELDDRTSTTAELQQSTSAAWRASLTQLARSPMIAEAVIAELADQLGADLRTPSKLARSVESAPVTAADARTAADVIRITATTGDPEQSALIANSWAKHFVAHVNQVYGQVPAETVAAVEGELAAAQTAYLAAQTNLEQFIAGSQVDSLQRRIDEKIALRDNLQLGRNSLLAAVADQDRNARLGLFTSLASAQTQGPLQVLDQSVKAEIDALSRLYVQRAVAAVQLEQARNLAAQIEEGGAEAAATSVLALQMLKMQTFAGEPGLALPAQAGSATSRVNLTVPDVTPSAAQLTEDAQALAATLEDYLTQLDADIAALSETLLADPAFAFLDQIHPSELAAMTPISETAIAATAGAYADALARSYDALFDVGGMVTQFPDLNAGAAADPLQETLAQLDADLQVLRAEQAAEQAREQQLTQQRDLTWTAYDALSNKLIELNMARTSSNSEVRLGSLAVAPDRPEPQASLLLPLAVAGMVAVVVALIVAFTAHALGRRPLFSKA